VYRLLCYTSYALVGILLLVGVAAAGALNAAWDARRPGVKWSEGPGALAVWRPGLFTAEGQSLRRRALRLQLATFALMALTAVLALVLSRSSGPLVCWR
jgi:hypothetical protein